MKALIRRKGEIVTEYMGNPYIDWLTGMPLTNSEWAGGPYTLIENYTPPIEDELEDNNTSKPDVERIAEIAELKARLAVLEDGL